LSDWLVGALLAASELPDAPFEALDCRIEPLEHPEWTPEIPQGLALQPAVEQRGAPFATEPPRMRFFAYHRALTRVSALDDTGAVAAASENFRRLVAALGVARPPIQPGPLFWIAATAEIPPGTPVGAPLAAIDQRRLLTNVSGFAVTSPRPEWARHVRALTVLSMRDSATNGLLRLSALAEESHRFTFSDEDLQDALIACARVVEGVANAATPEVLPDVSSEIEKTGSALSEVLNKELAKDHGQRSARRIAAAIRAAQDRISELRFQTTGQRLRHAATAFGAPAALASDVYSKVWKLRSERGGHGIQPPPSDQEVATAREVTWKFLRLYFAWRWSLVRQG